MSNGAPRPTAGTMPAARSRRKAPAPPRYAPQRQPPGRARASPDVPDRVWRRKIPHPPGPVRKSHSRNGSTSSPCPAATRPCRCAMSAARSAAAPSGPRCAPMRNTAWIPRRSSGSTACRIIFICWVVRSRRITMCGRPCGFPDANPVSAAACSVIRAGFSRARGFPVHGNRALRSLVSPVSTEAARNRTASVRWNNP